MDPKTAAFIRKLAEEHKQLKAQNQQIMGLLRELEEQPSSPTEEIDSIPGRRIFYNLSGRQEFDISDLGTRGSPISFNISQDGPFIMTGYPVVSWKPIGPAAATNLGQWSPVSSWPLPAQNTANQDHINISWEFFDSGSQRAFNNEAAVPLFSRPDAIQPLPVWTLLAPNSVSQFIPTYEDIYFDPDPEIPTDRGLLVVTLAGFRIANL